MKKPPLHEKEEDRLGVLHQRALLENAQDTHFNAIVTEATAQLGVSMSTVTLIEKEDEIYVSCVGVDSRGGPRDQSFCGHALVSVDVLVCEDTHLDARFSDNPYVTGPPFIRFYMGIKLLDGKTGLPLGVFCVKDGEPRKVSMDDTAAFLLLADRCQEILNTL